jgi:hypothetical protein
LRFEISDLKSDGLGRIVGKIMSFGDRFEGEFAVHGIDAAV